MSSGIKRLFVVAAITLLTLVGAWLSVPDSALYVNGKPTRLGRIANRLVVLWANLGLPPSSQVTFETQGRTPGRVRAIPLAVADYEDGRYLVSMMGNGAAWVRNVRRNGGIATIRHGRRQRVFLEEVPEAVRAPILKAYLKRAPGARPYFPIGPGAPLAAFSELAGRYPVFRIRKASERS